MPAIRISQELFDAAQKEARQVQRSAAGQIEHWAQIGRALDTLGLTAGEVKETLARGRSAKQRGSSKK